MSLTIGPVQCETRVKNKSICFQLGLGQCANLKSKRLLAVSVVVFV
jgi:hypothetical protein